MLFYCIKCLHEPLSLTRVILSSRSYSLWKLTLKLSFLLTFLTQMKQEKKGKSWKHSLAHQWMLQHYHVLPLPFGLKHFCKVGAASTENAAVSTEGFAMNNENNVTLVTLLQQPVRNKERGNSLQNEKGENGVKLVGDMVQSGLNEQIPLDIAVSPCPVRRPAQGLVLHILDWDLSLPAMTQRSFIHSFIVQEEGWRMKPS